MNPLLRDLWRVAPVLLAASLLLWLGGPLAQLFERPELSAWCSFASLALYGVALSMPIRRLMFPYLDLRVVAEEAKTSPGRGMVFLGVCVVLAAVLMLMGGLVRAETLHPNAVRYLPVLQAEQRAHWPDMPDPAILAAQVEKETCITLKHSKCWSPQAELRTARERGVGFGQITQTARFDALAELRAQFPHALSGWAWNSPSLYDPSYQMRGLVLMDWRNFRLMQHAATQADRLHFMLAGYNGGVGGVNSDIAVCRGTPGCDPKRWFGHVEHTSRKARTAANGYGQGFFQINRGYVARITQRASFYRGVA